MGGDLPLELFPVEQTPRPRPARAAAQVGDEALVRFGVQARELGEWLGLVVDPQAELGVGHGRVDEQRGRLLAALVAARRLTGLQGNDQSLGERQGTRSVVCLPRLSNDREFEPLPPASVLGNVRIPSRASALFRARGRALIRRNT
jgi:hypothetical protein